MGSKVFAQHGFRWLAPGLVVLWLAGCVGPAGLPPPTPELVGQRGDPPPLLPLRLALAQAGDARMDSEDAGRDRALDARAAALRARAARLRGVSVGPQ